MHLVGTESETEILAGHTVPQIQRRLLRFLRGFYKQHPNGFDSERVSTEVVRRSIGDPQIDTLKSRPENK